MTKIEDQSIHLIVTSPPYWQLKDQQIGFSDTYEEYIENLNTVWRECLRVLQDGCRLCINIGDICASAKRHGWYRILPIHAEIVKFCCSIGFDYLGAIIWQKITNCKPSGGAKVMGSYPFPRNGVIKQDYEFVLVFKKRGSPPPVDKIIKEQSRLTSEEWNTYFTGHWQIPGVRQVGHTAQFPVALPRRLIKMFSFKGDVILDPFLGSGTTTLAAIDTSRHSVGYEINPKYRKVIQEKLRKNAQSLDETELSFENDKTQTKMNQSVSSQIKSAPAPSLCRHPETISERKSACSYPCGQDNVVEW